MRLQPINDRVLVRRVEAERVTPGGIHLLEVRKTGEGEVAAAGPDASVQQGDRVLFAHGRHETTTFEGEELLVLRDEDLLAVLEP